MATQLIDDGLIGRLLLGEQGDPLAEVARRLPASLDLPEAAVVRAATALRQGEPAGKDRCARELESARSAHGEDIDPRLAVAVAVTDALRACLTDDLARAERVVAEAERLLAGPSAAPGQEHATELETVVTFARGTVALRRGDLAEARAGLARTAMTAPGAVSAAFRADCLGHLAVADALRGELVAAVRHAEEALSTANRAGLGTLELPPSAHVALAWVGVERCDGPLTTEHVTAARSSRALPADPFCSSLVEAATATLEESTGHAELALDRLVRATEASASRDPWIADCLRVEAAWLRLREGAPERALAVLECVAQPDRPEVAVASAAACAACAEQGSPRGMSGLPVRDGAAPLGTQVRALLVGAAQAAHDRSPRQATPALSRALRLASQQHLRRPFQECDASLHPLLRANPGLAREHGWLHHAGVRTGPTRPPESNAGMPAFVEPLTPKELEVLDHLAKLLTTEEIAEVMFVSVNTVRTHVRKILRKLGVNRRNAAIRRARELGLLED
jgi:LuxR family maltose regulon positive regulatory protein